MCREATEKEDGWKNANGRFITDEVLSKKHRHRFGKWLERAGFNAGDKIVVDCQQGRLIITKDESEADAETR